MASTSALIPLDQVHARANNNSTRQLYSSHELMTFLPSLKNPLFGPPTARGQQFPSACTGTQLATQTAIPITTGIMKVKITTKTMTTTPTLFLRSFSTAFSITAPAITSLLQAKFPRLRSEDSPSRLPHSRKRRYPSPLFDPAPSSNNNSSSGPPRQPPPSSSNSTIATFIALADKRIFNGLPERFVLYTIFALNFVVFSAWVYASETLKKFSDPRPFIFLSKNFLSGWPNVDQGRWWTMLTSCVSHEKLDHFALNMISLAFMAPPVLALTGPTTFVLLYFGSGVFSSIVSMIGKKLVPAEAKQGARNGGFSHGASGSVYAIMSTFACVHPTATFLVFFVIPAPAWACVTSIFAWDLWHAANMPGGKTDSAGHLGGILAGILFWRFGLRGVRIQ
ncbi:related to PCP1 - mitochondrial serine protease [Melanopsichium pennsylvanicum]|uniref:Related to PCP1 - mitochondrial serine protease n=2 Tax=Melanopsichium pennsylvanicum TaxID=63383 RepID=A0AAJ4XNL4_9BASI|nr:rhomboid-domain-containing protein [Melanopsichium pennsylvanicum 4]SNX85522.1 related to PCP1 - mitochondrial serine protease [Melanopsichium pennsylvanicum]